MTQSNFFRLSLFHDEDRPSKQKANNNQFAPWGSNQSLPIEAFKINKVFALNKPQAPPAEEQKKDNLKLPSNLLPNHKPSNKRAYIVPKLPKVEPLNKNLKHEIKSRGMPIKDFLSQKREQKELEQRIHKKSIAKINQSIQNSFLAKRSHRNKNGYNYSKTIDLKRDLYNPLQIYRSQQIVQFSPQKPAHPKQFTVLEKYLPIKSERYQL